MMTGADIVKKLFSSENKVDLLALFHKNPGLIDTMAGVARRIGRTAETIETDVRDFVDLGLLRTTQIGKLEAIRLSRAKDTEIQEILVRYMKVKGKGA